MFLKPSAIAAGCMRRARFVRCRGVPGLGFPVGTTIVHHASGGRLRTWVASWPLGRLPAQLGADCPPLLVSANALGSSPGLPLVTSGRRSKTPLFAGFSVL